MEVELTVHIFMYYILFCITLAIEWSARIAVNSSTEVTTSAPVPVESSARPSMT